MTGEAGGSEVLAAAYIDSAVAQARPDYRALLVVAEGVRGGPSDEVSDAALRRAELIARERLAGAPPESLPEVEAWRDALRGFGVKPRQARSSVEALLRRVDSGLPRINFLTDLYNAVSIEHLLPVGGEDLGCYVGPPRLVSASGDEPFDTVADGDPVTDVPEPGEIVWRDDVGVTCRRWNWRQCVRTRLTEATNDALFILDALEPVGSGALAQAGDELVARLAARSPGATITTRTLGPS